MANGFAWRVVAIAAAGYAMHTDPLFAQTRDVEPRFAVRVGAETTDNLARAPSAAAERETFLSTGVDIGAERESARARGYIDGAIDHYAYDSNQFETDPAGALDAGFSFRVVPEVFCWDFSDRIEHVRSDPFAPVTPGNRERVNTFATGPRASIPLGERSRFGVMGQYGDRRYEESAALEGETRTASLDFSHDLSSMQRLGLTVAARDIGFDDPASRPYEIHDSYVTYERQGASASSFSVSAGTSRLRSDGAPGSSEPYFDLAWTRDVTARSRVTLDVGQHFEGAAEDFDAGSLEGFESAGIGDTLLVPDPRVRSETRLTYVLSRPRATFTAWHERFDEEYQSSGLPQREGTRSSVAMDYRLTPVLRGSVEYGIGDETFELAETADERHVRATLARRLGRAWDGSLAFESNRREADRDGNYRERRYVLALTWRPVRD
jgi:hypothetical protein